LQEGPASVVVPIDKLSILVTVAFSVLMLREHVSGRYLLGIAGMRAGAVLMVIG
ncbi:MAG: EamA family transporter, partial [Trueperella pyogenes]|nr:EamA family transporter [Trueperella pyogenes]